MFDMDGLLLDSERVCRDSFIQAGQEFGIPASVNLEEVFLSCVGLRSDDGDKILTARIGPYLDLRAFGHRWDALIHATFAVAVPLKEGALQVVRQLTHAGIPCGVVTSTRTDLARRHLKDAGLLPHILHVIGGDAVGFGKPDPEGYIAMAAILGHSVADCAAFEDSNTGIKAAVASGARAVQVPDLVPADDATQGQIIAPDLITGARMAGFDI